MSEIATIPLLATIGQPDVVSSIEARLFVQLAHWIPASVHHCLGARPSCGSGVPSLRAAGARLAGGKPFPWSIANAGAASLCSSDSTMRFSCR